MFSAEEADILGLDTETMDAELLVTVNKMGLKYIEREWSAVQMVKEKSLGGLVDLKLGEFDSYVRSIFVEIDAFVKASGVSALCAIEQSVYEKLLEIFRISKKVKDKIPEELEMRALNSMRIFIIAVKLPEMDLYKIKILQQLRIFMQTYAKMCDYIFKGLSDEVKLNVMKAWEPVRTQSQPTIPKQLKVTDTPPKAKTQILQQKTNEQSIKHTQSQPVSIQTNPTTTATKTTSPTPTETKPASSTRPLTAKTTSSTPTETKSASSTRSPTAKTTRPLTTRLKKCI